MLSQKMPGPLPAIKSLYTHIEAEQQQLQKTVLHRCEEGYRFVEHQIIAVDAITILS